MDRDTWGGSIRADNDQGGGNLVSLELMAKHIRFNTLTGGRTAFHAARGGGRVGAAGADGGAG